MTPTDKAAIEGLIAIAEKAMPLRDRALRTADSLVLRALDEAVPALQRLLAGETSRPNPETRAVDVPRGLIEALRDHQEQCDEDGVECQVSRQAVDEAVEILSKPLYRSPVESAPALAPFEKLTVPVIPASRIESIAIEFRNRAEQSAARGKSTKPRILRECADRLSAIVKEWGK